MKILKYLVIAFLLTASFVSAQQFNFKSTALSILQKNRNGEWGKWSNPKPTTVFAKLDYDNDKIIIYSTEIQHYKIIEYLPKEVSNVDEINSYLCKNIDGIAVKIAFIVRTDSGYKTQLYVYNEDFVFCYDIIEVTK